MSSAGLWSAGFCLECSSGLRLGLDFCGLSPYVWCQSPSTGCEDLQSHPCGREPSFPRQFSGMETSGMDRVWAHAATTSLLVAGPPAALSAHQQLTIDVSRSLARLYSRAFNFFGFTCVTGFRFCVAPSHLRPATGRRACLFSTSLGLATTAVGPS